MTTQETWDEFNHKCLVEYFNNARSLLKNHVAMMEVRDNKKLNESTGEINLEVDTSTQIQNRYISAIDNIAILFGLSKFEKFILILCAGVEVDSELYQLCQKILGIYSKYDRKNDEAYQNTNSTDNSNEYSNSNSNDSYVTFGLVLAICPQISHWSAFAPISPLRKYKLIELFGFPHTTLTNSILRINERILHYIIGISYLEKDLLNMVRPISVYNIRNNNGNSNNNLLIVPSHTSICDTISNVLCKNKELLFDQKSVSEPNSYKLLSRGERRLPLIHLIGNDEISKINIAKWVCNKFGLSLYQLDWDTLPFKPEEIGGFMQLWARESLLLGSALYITFNDSELTHTIQTAVKRLLISDELQGIVFVSTMKQLELGDSLIKSFEVRKPLKHEQYDIWKSLLGDDFCTTFINELSKITDQFDLNASSIEVAAKDALISASIDRPIQTSDMTKAIDDVVVTDENAQGNKNNIKYHYQRKLINELWKSSIKASRPNVGDLAQQIRSIATINDIVLPAREKSLLRDMAIHVRQRSKVYDAWGFDESGGSVRGLGLSALFSGESGTGKTMAAEALANELHLELFKIDLSMVVNKYIGETEKNLHRIFDASEGGGIVLFFDEADALFGKRSEVTNSHDRYANIEVSYLLQRMESYKGLAILATNMKNAIDPAFTRRISFIVNFPFPDEKSRAEIWKRIFPQSVKTAELDIARLARLNISGGNIRNIALNASFLASEANVPVNMKFIKQAAQTEYDKLGRSLTKSEVGDWS